MKDTMVQARFKAPAKRPLTVGQYPLGSRVPMDFGSAATSDQDVGALWWGGTSRIRKPGLKVCLCLLSIWDFAPTPDPSELWLLHLWKHYLFSHCDLPAGVTVRSNDRSATLPKCNRWDTIQEQVRCSLLLALLVHFIWLAFSGPSVIFRWSVRIPSDI